MTASARPPVGGSVAGAHNAAPSLSDVPVGQRGSDAPAGSARVQSETGPTTWAANADENMEPRSLGELINEVTADLSTLMRQEVALAKAEMTQSAKRAGKVAGMFGGAGYAAHLVLLFLSIAAWWAIGTAIGLGWSALIIAAIWAIVAAVLAARGRAEMAHISGLEKTAETVKKIPNALKGEEELNR
jgi:hypothetical protein